MKAILLVFFGLSLIPLVSSQIEYEAENVKKLGQWDNDDLPTNAVGTFNDIWGYAADGREYAIMGSAAYIHFFDVTNPSNITLIDEFLPGDTTVWRDFKVFQNYCYAVSDKTEEGLLIYDLSDLPNSVNLVNTVKTEFVQSHNIYIDIPNGRLYTAGAGHGSLVYDLNNDPSKPEFLGVAHMNNNYVHDIYVRDNIAYASSGNPGFFIWDLTDPVDEKLLASTETNGYNHSSWVSEDGRFAVFAEEVPTGLPMGIMDLTSMKSGDIQVESYYKFPLLAPAETGATAHNPYIRGDYAFTSYYQDGLVIFDVSDPSHPTRAGYFDTYPDNTAYPGYQGAWGCFPYLPSGNILVSDIDYGLFVLDFEAGTNRPEQPFSLEIQPNPASFMTEIHYDLPAIGTLNLYSMNGSLIRSQVVDGGVQKLQMLLGTLPSGVYIVELVVEDERQVKKLIVYNS